MIALDPSFLTVVLSCLKMEAALIGLLMQIPYHAQPAFRKGP